MSTYSTRTWISICNEVDKDIFSPTEVYRFKGERVFYDKLYEGYPYYVDDGTPYITTDDTPYYVRRG